MNEHGGYYAKGNKPVTGRQIQQNSHLYEIFKRARLIEAKNGMVVVRGWGEGEMGSCYSLEIKFHLCKMKNLRDL